MKPNVRTTRRIPLPRSSIAGSLSWTSGAAVNGHGSALENAEGQHGRAEPVAQFVREGAQALGSSVDERLLAQPLVLRDGLGDGVVETAVQRVKLVDCDVRVELECELGHRLAHVSVVVNDLAHAESHAKHVVAMLRRARFHHDDHACGGGERSCIDGMAKMTTIDWTATGQVP
jgi:hypothetical protein